MQRYGFPKSAHLRSSADFRKVYAEGRRHNLEWVVAFTRPNGNRASRIGFTIPAVFGPAVTRNRMRRRLREAARRNWAELGPGWDIVLNPRRAALQMQFARLEEGLRRLFQSCARAAAHPDSRS